MEVCQNNFLIADNHYVCWYVAKNRFKLFFLLADRFLIEEKFYFVFVVKIIMPFQYTGHRQPVEKHGKQLHVFGEPSL
jgi:hypothetical protein